MRWSKVAIEAVAYELPDEKWTSAELEKRLLPLYRALNLGAGHIESLTGIVERRMWPQNTPMNVCAARAAKKALAAAGMSADRIGTLIYAGVCRDQLEPATACAVAESLGVGASTLIHDISNACLGVLNGIVTVANQIELGHIRTGIVVSSESAREIIDSSIARMCADPTLERYRLGLATMTGGSGAVAVVLTHIDDSDTQHRLTAGAYMAAPEHNRICYWGPSRGLLGESTNVMNTDASQVLTHGVKLGRDTWSQLLKNTGWEVADVDRVICHQVGSSHRSEVLKTLGIDASRDFSTFSTLGNIGTVSLLLTLSRAEEEGFVRKGDRTALLGIGSGLNCLMLATHW